MSKEEFVNNVLPIRATLENYALSILRNRDEAEDVVQEVYIKLWCMRDKLSGYRSVEALSFVVTKNLCLNRLNTNKRLMSTELMTELKASSEQPDTTLIDKDDLEKALQIIEQLPNLQQAILKMRHMEGLEIAEIARLTGSNEGAVRTNLSRARNTVRTLFMEMQNYEQ